MTVLFNCRRKVKWRMVKHTIWGDINYLLAAGSVAGERPEADHSHPTQEVASV